MAPEPVVEPIEPVLLPEPEVPAPPIDDVEPGVLLEPLAVVSLLEPVLPVVVLGDVLPLRLPEPVVEPVVVEGVVLLLLVPLVPLEPVVDVSPVPPPRLQALRETAAAIASATAVSWVVFIRYSLFGVGMASGSRSCPVTTLSSPVCRPVGTGSKRV